jgi:hypothetical protein
VTGRLVRTFTGDGRTEGAMKDTFMGSESGTAATRTPSGVVIDGNVSQLAGQPPVAQSHGWGDLSFLRHRRFLTHLELRAGG